MNIRKEVTDALIVMALSAVVTALACAEPIKPVAIHIAQPVVKVQQKLKPVAIVIKPVMAKPTTTIAAK